MGLHVNYCLAPLTERSYRKNTNHPGGGVYKKRLNQNLDRAIILAKGGEHWFYTFLYDKQDMANIDNRELAGFRELAKHYAALSDEKITALIKRNELVEICHDCKK
ncbi:hypothetical protein ABIC12_004372 [Pantoea agglomerans]